MKDLSKKLYEGILDLDEIDPHDALISALDAMIPICMEKDAQYCDSMGGYRFPMPKKIGVELQDDHTINIRTFKMLDRRLILGPETLSTLSKCGINTINTGVLFLYLTLDSEGLTGWNINAPSAKIEFRVPESPTDIKKCNIKGTLFEFAHGKTQFKRCNLETVGKISQRGRGAIEMSFGEMFSDRPIKINNEDPAEKVEINYSLGSWRKPRYLMHLEDAGYFSKIKRKCYPPEDIDNFAPKQWPDEIFNWMDWDHPHPEIIIDFPTIENYRSGTIRQISICNRHGYIKPFKGKDEVIIWPKGSNINWEIKYRLND